MVDSANMQEDNQQDKACSSLEPPILPEKGGFFMYLFPAWIHINEHKRRKEEHDENFGTAVKRCCQYWKW